MTHINYMVDKARLHCITPIVSAAIPAHTVIFPLSSIVFGIESIAGAVTEWPPAATSDHLDPNLIQR